MGEVNAGARQVKGVLAQERRAVSLVQGIRLFGTNELSFAPWPLAIAEPTPNPSIERTSNIRLRLLLAAAHFKR